MSKIVISADSTCDLPPELAAQYDIHILPLTVVLGDELRSDGVDVKPQELFDYVARTGDLPKTSAVTLGAYTEFFEKMKAEGNEVVHISLSSSFSSCYNNAKIAAEDCGNAYVVDSKNLSSGSAHVAIEAAQKAAEGMSAADIAAYLEDFVKHVDASFIIDAIPYLYKGGRCSAVAAFGANLLKIKPCIEVVDGAMAVGKKYRGLMKDTVRAYTRDRLAVAAQGCRRDRVFVTDSCSVHPELVDVMMEEVNASGLFDTVLRNTAGSTISSHCGPDCIGVLFVRS